MEALPARQRLRAQIDLPTPVAIWVLGAHAIALLTPLLLLWAVHANWEFVAARTDAPGLLYVAVGVMMVASAFEIAQNTSDNWYLEHGMGSTTQPALADFAFYLFSSAGVVILIAACMGDSWWLIAISGLLVGVFAFLYLTDRTPFAATAILGVISAITLYMTFGDPVVFIQIVTGQLTLYFFILLLKTRAQSMHGCTALANASGLWVLAVAIAGSASGETRSWVFVIGLVIGLGLGAILLKPGLEKLAATPRRRG